MRGLPSERHFFPPWRAALACGRKIDMKYSFVDFFKYTAEVNSFLPAAVIPFVAWPATIAETSLVVLLIAGIWKRCPKAT
jgi:hypothetical protein